MSGGLIVAELFVKRGQRAVVRDVSLQIPSGQVTALIGPNGAGKSTMVAALAGLLPADGSVTLDGDELAGARPETVRAAGLAVVPEGHRILRRLTVFDNLRAATSGMARADASKGIDWALDVFSELQPKARSLAGSLSGGQQQMLAIAQALVRRPKYLVIDELSFGLAPVVVSRLLPTIKGVAAEGVGVLLIEQFTRVALAMSETTYVMEGGRIRHVGSSAQLRERPEMLHSSYLGRARAGAGA
jgi:branched-chain amino acid transport system ATP-binding protein